MKDKIIINKKKTEIYFILPEFELMNKCMRILDISHPLSPQYLN